MSFSDEIGHFRRKCDIFSEKRGVLSQKMAQFSRKYEASAKESVESEEEWVAIRGESKVELR